MERTLRVGPFDSDEIKGVRRRILALFGVRIVARVTPAPYVFSVDVTFDNSLVSDEQVMDAAEGN